MQRLQTIIATNTAEPIIRSLPLDLHPYIYKFISDEVKLHYWMEKYDLENIMHQICEDYGGLHLITSYYRHANEPIESEFDMLYSIGVYREKDKIRDTNGRIIRVEWYWNDDLCNYNEVFPKFAKTLKTQYTERRDMNGLYKYFGYLLSLLDNS